MEVKSTTQSLASQLSSTSKTKAEQTQASDQASQETQTDTVNISQEAIDKNTNPSPRKGGGGIKTDA